VNVALPDGNILRGIAITRGEARANILYFGGGAEVAQAATLEMTKWADLYNVNAIFVDYRGYGASSGLPAVKWLAYDSLHVHDQTSELRQGLPTFVVGYSIGSLPATFLAANRLCDGLVLIAPITSFEDQDMYPKGQTHQQVPWYRRPFSGRSKRKPNFEIPKKTEPIYQIPDVDAPLLVIHGEDDAEVPSVCGMKIYSLARGRKTMRLLPGQGHDRISLAEGKGAEALAKFIDECIKYPY
jgi:pimeloyl-ACP methyl ester carboxylesterase